MFQFLMIILPYQDTGSSYCSLPLELTLCESHMMNWKYVVLLKQSPIWHTIVCTW